MMNRSERSVLRRFCAGPILIAMKRTSLLVACLLLGTVLSSCRGFRAANDMAGLLHNPEFERTGPNVWSFDFPEQDYDTTGSSRAARRATMIALLYGWKSFVLEKSAVPSAAGPPAEWAAPVRYENIGRSMASSSSTEPEILGGEITDWTHYVARFSARSSSPGYPNDALALGQQFAAEGTREARHWQILLDRVSRKGGP